MSFGGNTDHFSTPRHKPLGVDESRLSSAEEGKAVPIFWGRRRIGVTFISDVFDTRKVPVERDSGKQKNKVGTLYYASFAVLPGHGPITRVESLHLNNELAWSIGAAGTFNGADYLDFAIVKPNGRVMGNMRVYAGTETQTPDSYLISKSGVDHPAYRGFAYAVFDQLFLGFNQTNVPTVEFTVDRIPDVAWMTSEATLDPSVIACNPIACVADLMQNPRAGLGLPDARLATTSLAAKGDQLKTEKLGIAPLVERPQETRSIITELLQYADAFPIITPAGLFDVGLVRKPADVNALPVVDESAFVRRPEIAPDDWTKVHTETRVKHKHPTLTAVETVTTWRDRGAVRITGEPSSIVVQRPFANTTEAANAIVAAAGRANAVPGLSGRLWLRKTGNLFAQLTPGALFKLNYPSRNITGLVARVQERTEPGDGKPEFNVTWKVDRSHLTPTATSTQKSSSQKNAKSGDPEEPAETPALEHVRVVELPLALCPDGKLSLAILAARSASTQVGYGVHIAESYDWDGAPAASYNFIATHGRFAMHGALYESFSATTDLVDNVVGLLVGFDGVDTTLGEFTPFDAVTDDLLVFVGDEVLSVHRAELVDVNLYRLFCLRGRMATPIEAHAAAAEVFVIYRRDIEALQHPQFALHNDFTLKLTPTTGAQTLALADAPESTGTIAGRIYRDPALANLSVNGLLAGATYSTGEDIVLAWTLTDAGADFWQAEKIARNIVVEVLDGTSAVVGTIVLGGNVATHTIPNATLSGYLGGQVSFTARVKRRTTVEFGIVDSNPISLSVTKV